MTIVDNRSDKPEHIDKLKGINPMVFSSVSRQTSVLLDDSYKNLMERQGGYVIDFDLDIAVNFDGRKAWSGLMTTPYDQGHCSACWAFAAASILSDRFNIQSVGQLNTRLSAARIVLCARDNFIQNELAYVDGSSANGNESCEGGGSLLFAFHYLFLVGTFSCSCLPAAAEIMLRDGTVYPALNSVQHVNLNCREVTGHDNDLCHDGTPARHWRASAFYVIPGPSDGGSLLNIQKDIFKWGPVGSTIEITKHFMNWSMSVDAKTDIYCPVKSDNEGWHAVSIVGWGETNGIEYWIIKNTWGDKWANGGYFLLQKGINALGVETHVISLTPDFFQDKNITDDFNGLLNDSNYLGIPDSLKALRLYIDGNSNSKSYDIQPVRFIDSLTGYTFGSRLKEDTLTLPLNTCLLPRPWKEFYAGNIPRSKLGRWWSRKKYGVRRCYWYECLLVIVFVLLGVIAMHYCVTKKCTKKLKPVSNNFLRPRLKLVRPRTRLKLVRPSR